MFTIRTYKKKDLQAVTDLICLTYATCNSKEGTKQAAQDYLDYYSLEKNQENIEKKFAESPLFFVAEQGKKVIGVIRGKADRISNLFVHPQWHGKGVGQALLTRFEKKTVQMQTVYVKLYASLFAVSFYQRMGYKKTTGVRWIKGLPVQPMKKIMM